MIWNLFKKKSSFNVSEIVASLVHKKYLNEIAAELKDPRNIYEIAGEYFPGGARGLATKVAKKLELPFVNQIEAANALPLYQNFPVTKLQKLGVFPVSDSNSVAYLVAVDPVIAREMLGVNKDYPIAIGSWTTITNAWNELEVLYQKQQAKDLKFDTKKLIEQTLSEKVEIDQSLGQTSEHTPDQNSEQAPAQQPEVVSKEDIVSHFTEQHLALDVQVELEEKSRAKKLYLIDDSNIFSSVLKRYLKDTDYKFEIFRNPKKALESLKVDQFVPDLIICDLHMPQMTGLEVLTEIRTNAIIKDLPFILLTSDTEVDTKLELLDAGVDAFIGKNEDPRLISAQVRALLKRSRSCQVIN